MPVVNTETPEQRHWRRSRRLTNCLLLLWAIASFGAPYFARDLSQRLFGWPLSFWLAAQGGLLAYLLVVVVYDRLMRRYDAELLAEEGGP